MLAACVFMLVWGSTLCLQTWDQSISELPGVPVGLTYMPVPVGTVLFVGSAVAKVSIEKVVKALTPFFIALFMVLLAVTYIPAISLWLPNMVLKP